MDDGERWIAFIDEDGSLIEVRELDDSTEGPSSGSYPGALHAMGATREEAQAKARRDWEKARNESE